MLALALTAGGCAARVPLRVPPAPSVVVAGRAIAVIAVDRECRNVADLLAARLDGMDGIDVQPTADARLNLYGCTVAWARAKPTSDVAHGSALAVAAVSDPDGVVANLIGAGHTEVRAAGSESIVRLPRSADDALYQQVARDLAEQVAPVSTFVHRRIYNDPADGSARQYHNLAVDAELNGKLVDAVWWATLAWEQDPNARRARYVDELERRLSRSRESISRLD